MFCSYESEVSQWAPQDSYEFRLGGSLKRHVIFDIARQWNRVNQEDPPFRVSVADAWLLTDNRPETTSEGRHWVGEGETFAKIRGIGEPAGAPFRNVTDFSECLG